MAKVRRGGLALICAVLVPAGGRAQQILIQPYLQAPSPTSMWILWETSTSDDESLVDWGTTAALGHTASGSAATGYVGSRVHSVRVDGLSPATRYHYRARTGSASSAVRTLVTPPMRDQASRFSLVAISDTQRDSSQPTKLDEIVHDGILDVAIADGTPVDEALALVLIAGDLVTSALIYSQWREQFFLPMADLLAQVPSLPVPGNHEFNSSSYFTLFHLPPSGGDEHRYYHDHGDLRVIGLDSNSGYRTTAQLDWLEAVLDASCADDQVDFVVVQLHHPAITELWPVGELGYALDVVERLEDFAGRCAKPTLYLFGHTHAYARGQSMNAPLVWVNVATAAGNIDYWGEYGDQYDADLFTMGFDDWGFVLIDVEAGADPQLTLRHLSRGNEDGARANEERDRVLLRRYNTPPAAPDGLAPLGTGIAPQGVVLQASAFVDADGDTHQASHWQLAGDCSGFAVPLRDGWRQDHNWYQGVDLQAGDDLTDEVVPDLTPGASYCWRVRYRDSALGWSAWSEPVVFTTAGGDAGALLDAGADAAGADAQQADPDAATASDVARSDAAVEVDAGTAVDAGVSLDAAVVDAVADAAVELDATLADHPGPDLAAADAGLQDGARTDTGLDAAPGVDLASPVDAATPLDAGSDVDAAVDGGSADAASADLSASADRGRPDSLATDLGSADAHLTVDGALLDAVRIPADVSALVESDAGGAGSHVVEGCGCRGVRARTKAEASLALLAVLGVLRRARRHALHGSARR